MRVLIVDDAAVIRLIIKDILIKGGFEIAGEARSGAEAVERYRELAPDLVTMDMMMPGMDGIEALREILALDPAAKVVMCTSIGRQGLVDEARAAGALAFITKPLVPAKIVETLRKVFG